MNTQSTEDDGAASRDEKRERIYRVAIDVFSEFGYTSGTTSEIATRVGLTQPALYHYADSKNAFLVMICRRIGDRMLARMDEALAIDGSAMERLRRLIVGHLEVVAHNPAAFGVYVTESRHLDSKSLKAIRKQERTYVRTFTQLVQQAQDEGSLDSSIEAWVFSRLALGSMNWTYRWFHDQVSVDELGDSTLSFLGVSSGSR